MNNNNNINFDDDNWLFTVSGALSIEKKLWGNIEVVEDYLRVDFISIYHIDTINQLSLNCWLPVNRETDYENLLEFCNLQNAALFPKVDIELDELFDVDDNVYYEQDVLLFLRIPSHGGISVPALQEIVKLFYEDVIITQGKLIDEGWLKEEIDFDSETDNKCDDQDFDYQDELEDRVVDLEDKLDELMAEFDDMMSDDTEAPAEEEMDMDMDMDMDSIEDADVSVASESATKQ